MEILVGLGLIIGLWVWWSAAASAARRKKLMAKYGDAQIVDAIMRRMIWQGMTYDQLVDSQGRPADVDEKVYKSKTVHVFKYGQDGRNRYRQRVTIENGEVVGWTQR